MERPFVLAGVAAVAASPLSAQLTVGTGDGSEHVRGFDIRQDGTPAEGPSSQVQCTKFFAYHPAFSGGVSVAAGDVNNDGVGNEDVEAAE